LLLAGWIISFCTVRSGPTTKALGTENINRFESTKGDIDAGINAGLNRV
jgi:hypothetical protein